VAEPFDDSIEIHSSSSSQNTGEGIVIDIGTGDGLFVYELARANPNKFYIGVDANPRPLEKISEKIHRRQTKGGLPNVLFLQAAIEDLPAELDGIANEVHVHFPWGSLLAIVARGDRNGLGNLRRILSRDGLLEIVIALDPERDESEIKRLGIQSLDATFISSELAPRYRDAGFEILEAGVGDPEAWSDLKTTWAKRLHGSKSRSLLYIVAKAI
jgi:16S rRNA (adenine(1408)-N(1))-methyltransferase